MVDKEPSLEGEDFKKVRLSDDSGAGLDLDLEPDSMSTVKIKKSSKFTKHELQSPGKTISYMTHSSNSPKSSSSPMLNFTEYSTQFDMHYEDTDHMAVINTFTVHTDLPTEPEGGFAGADLFSRRSPFVHNPPILEERRPRIEEPHGVCDYLINLREDLADFQESHGLPRSKDYSFLSLGLALAQETGRTLYAVLIMITELFPVLAILSLIIRFILDQLIDILETREILKRVKKSVVFTAELIIIVIPVYILVGTVLIPLTYLVFSIAVKIMRLTGSRKKKNAPPPENVS